MSHFKIIDNSAAYNGGRRTNHKQKLILIAAMATNRKILECRAGDSNARRAARDSVWKKVMVELNMAGPEKHISEWRKVWTDMRLSLRKKWQKAQKSKYVLTEYERRVIDACGMVEKLGDKKSIEKSSEDIDSFVAFLKDELIKEHELIQEYSHYFKEDNSNHISHNSNDHFKEDNSNHDSSEFITPEPSDIIEIKEELIEEPINLEEYEEPPMEWTIEDKPISKFDEVRDISVEESMRTVNIKLENSSSLPTENAPQPIQPKTEMVPSVPSAPLNKTNLPRKKKLKDATLKEIRTMHRNLLRESKKQTALLHRNLLRESKKQTALLKKLVQRMQQ